MNTLPFKLLLLAAALSLSSCDTSLSGCEADYDFETDNSLLFFLEDKYTGEYLLEGGRNRYVRSEVALYTEDLERIYEALLYDGGQIDYSFLQYPIRDEEPFDVPIAHTYYLYLEENDYDTLNIAYTIGSNRCYDRMLKYLKVSYNDSVYLDQANPPMGKSFHFLK